MKTVIEIRNNVPPLKLVGNTDRRVAKIEVYKSINGKEVLDREFKFNNDGGSTEEALNLAKALLVDLGIQHVISS